MIFNYLYFEIKCEMAKIKKLTVFFFIALFIQLSLSFRYIPGNIALVDHLNINHEKSRHDLVKSFYFETLGFTPDQRKQENYDKGRKTLWANGGITQFHLSEAPTAQVFDGTITVAYKSQSCLNKVEENLKNAPSVLLNSNHFQWQRLSLNEILVTDPWGSVFKLVHDETAEDTRGIQPGPISLPIAAISDLCIHIPADSNLDGIGRFYNQILGAPIVPSPPTSTSKDSINESNIKSELKVIVSPQQTLTFKKVTTTSSSSRIIEHSDIRIEDEGISNYGAHISLYIHHFDTTFFKVAEINSLFINHRFKRRAYNLVEAKEQCMFRCLDIIDPDNRQDGPIIRLEHEIRSIVTEDGQKYKSCPFFEIPPVPSSGF